MKKLFSFSVEIPQHPSKNIYSVLAFINILLKTATTKKKENPVKHFRKGGNKKKKEFSSFENFIGKTTCSFSHAIFISWKQAGKE